MKKKLLFLFICFTLGCLHFPSVVMGQDSGLSDEIRNSVILPFLKALKNGNVDEVEQYLSIDLYDKNRRLFEENSEYPNFLRNYYRNSELSVLKTAETADNVVFDVVVKFSDGAKALSTFIVEKVEENNKTTGMSPWRIHSIR